jgi:hypothetical protein
MVKAACAKNSAQTTSIQPEFTDSLLTNWGGLVPF